MYRQLNGPAVNGAIAVSTTAVELKVNATALEERIAVSIQPLDGAIYYGYSNSVSDANGTWIPEGQLVILEASEQLPVWLVTSSGTVDVRITEVS